MNSEYKITGSEFSLLGICQAVDRLEWFYLLHLLLLVQ